MWHEESYDLRINEFIGYRQKWGRNKDALIRKSCDPRIDFDGNMPRVHDF
jgi:hypothetical protein